MNDNVLEKGKTWISPPAPTARPDETAWMEIEAGRYQPRRFKGSFPGRELG